MNLPELLLPAGDKEKAYTAFRYGADAIYCGVAMFSLRTRENTFTEKDILEIVEYAHKNDKKVYVTLNAFPHQSMIKLIARHLAFLETIHPDGIIFADLGILALANEHAPSVPKHLSVQTSTMNIPAIKTWESLGVSRIICAREMSIKEVTTIHKQLPSMELEYFVHGSVCMAYSGRCLLSNFTGGRDANRGVCNHTCRWNYHVYDEEGRTLDLKEHMQGENSCCSLSQGSAKSIREFEKVGLVEHDKTPGEMMQTEEDIHGSHIMSSRDMCMIEHLEEIQKAGICSLKVEGRHKTAYYAATIARAYREALDNLAEGKPFDPTLWDDVHATANRGFFPGFFHGKPQSGDIQYESNRSTSSQEVCGIVERWENGRVFIRVKNKIEEGACLTFIFPKRKDDFSLSAQDLFWGDEKVAAVHGGHDIKLGSFLCEQEIPTGIFIRQKTQNKSQIPR